ncbi:NAD-dependent epimerase/dehydratase family protein [Niabella sp. CC-SYL272]|uniref:polysaccharide biosynthesis C-terminal domain-containing protein n=1 Tax=Niabella agricola TaxID=2891571 RepID=UPI001F218489|nr:NAD-dependent epimerase/dehydratase family protein [Niabella agricola]MCF3107515.1 NAD-dependent epimerase/dehydratase family protein [Niabella agricola]
MKKIGITGQEGFIGKHLYNTLNLYKEEFEVIPFYRNYFDDAMLLDAFVSQCDAIVHLAAMNRHDNPEHIYETNVKLVDLLIDALERTGSKPHVLFSSSSQEEKENRYGQSKKDGRQLLTQWAERNNASLTGMIIPNVFGPFGKPFYNSVIATFCHQVSKGETPQILVDGDLKLIYVGELAEAIIEKIRTGAFEPDYILPHTAEMKVSGILQLVQGFKTEYQEKGIIPELKTKFELNLFNTYRCYMDIGNHFPVDYSLHTDPRGTFVELMRLNTGGQISFSTTAPGVTRGNHFHTRKIERFAVIKGNALIRLRKIGTQETLEFTLSGDKPGYVDMPVWYAHNIKNTGNDDLYTVFWINEFYNAEDPDTFFENV